MTREIEVTINRPTHSSEIEVVVVEKDTQKYPSLYSAVRKIGRERYSGIYSLTTLGCAVTAVGIGIFLIEEIRWLSTGNVDWKGVALGIALWGNAAAMLTKGLNDSRRTSKIIEKLDNFKPSA